MSDATTDHRQDPMRLPNRICATCGRPTSTSAHHSTGWGDFHHECRRDVKGRLIVVTEKDAA